MSGRPARKKIGFSTPRQPETLASRIFGVRSIESEPAAVRRAVMKGVPTTKLRAVREVYAFSQAEMAEALGVTARTLTRKGRTRTPLGLSASDGTARLVRVFDRAVEVLGTRDRATEWLRTSNDALGGDAPRTWLDTDAGTAEVLRVLGRLEHGVFS